MCSYRTWYYEDKVGYVIECDKCKKMQIGFGNVLIGLLKEEFCCFRIHIMNVFEQEHAEVAPGVKHIMIPTPCTGLTLLLSTQELNDLYLMLETADNEIKTDELIQLFYKEEKK